MEYLHSQLKSDDPFRRSRAEQRLNGLNLEATAAEKKRVSVIENRYAATQPAPKTATMEFYDPGVREMAQIEKPVVQRAYARAETLDGPGEDLEMLLDMLGKPVLSGPDER